jgi:hypothetical protein
MADIASLEVSLEASKKKQLDRVDIRRLVPQEGILTL